MSDGAPGPLVSVVTPFYNTRQFLAECIESVCRQTYQNWEYVLVDNFSDDGSSDIAAQYLTRFPDKIRVVRPPKFLNQVENYNFALTCISPQSTYCKMVQADDWLFPDCIRAMVELAEKHPKVGIVAAYELEGDHVALDGLKYPSAETLGSEICRLYFLARKYLFGTPTSLLLRAEIVRARQPFFDARHAPFEDAHACFDLLATWNFGFVHQVLTFSRRDNPSILSSIRPFGFERFAHLAKVVTHGRQYLSEAEYRRILGEAEHGYFLYLGKSVFHGRGRSFWQFHRERLESIGYSLGWQFWAIWVSLAVLEYLGNPKQTCEYFWDRRRKALNYVWRLLASST